MGSRGRDVQDPAGAEVECIRIIIKHVVTKNIHLQYACILFYCIFIKNSYVFWIGDLNFRIDDLTQEEVQNLIEKKDFETLRKKDQVTLVEIYGCFDILYTVARNWLSLLQNILL